MAGTLVSTRRRALAGLAAATACAVTARVAPAAPAVPIEWPELDWISGAKLSRAELDGVPAIVVFWASYCAYCQRHNAHVDRLYRAVDPRRLHVLSVAVDSDAAGVRQYMATNGFRFPVALDAGLLRARFTDRRVVPLTCTVGGDGRRGLCIPGEMTEADVIDLARLAGPGAR